MRGKCRLLQGKVGNVMKTVVRIWREVYISDGKRVRNRREEWEVKWPAGGVSEGKAGGFNGRMSPERVCGGEEGERKRAVESWGEAGWVREGMRTVLNVGGFMVDRPHD